MQSLDYALNLHDDQFGRSITGAEKKVNRFDKAVNRSGRGLATHSRRGAKGMGGLGAMAKRIAPLMAGAFALSTVISFGKEVFGVTSKMQKYEAILTNTLGSKDFATGALVGLQEQAAKMPFSFDELTNSYVKLSNQGLVPTTDEITKLGDLASSTGKSFDQLTEAVLDAKTGEFERLKEFGIKTRKEGDLLTFSFKGVETQVKYNDEAIKNYLVGLGDVEGVSGSMAAIMGTLEGKTSNLGDKMVMLKAKIGTQLTPAFNWLLDKGMSAVNFFDRMVDSSWPVREGLHEIWVKLAPLREGLTYLADALGINNESTDMASVIMEGFGFALEVVANSIGRVAKIGGALIKTVVDIGSAIGKVLHINDAFGIGWKNVWTGIKTFTTMIGNYVSEKLGGIGDMISGLFSGDTDKMKAGAKRYKDAYVDMASASTWKNTFADERRKEFDKEVRRNMYEHAQSVAKKERENQATIDQIAADAANKRKLQEERNKRNANNSSIAGSGGNTSKLSSGNFSIGNSAPVRHIEIKINSLIQDLKIMSQTLPKGVQQTTDVLHKHLTAMLADIQAQ